MILSSTHPAVNQFFNARREGPIGMAEEKDDATMAQERETVVPARPAPIPPQLMPSDGRVRPAMRRPGEWLAAHGIDPPPGSFIDDQGRDWRTNWDSLTAAPQPPP